MTSVSFFRKIFLRILLCFVTAVLIFPTFAHAAYDPTHPPTNSKFNSCVTGAWPGLTTTPLSPEFCANRYPDDKNTTPQELVVPTNPLYEACVSARGVANKTECALRNPDTAEYLKCVSDGGSKSDCAAQNTAQKVAEKKDSGCGSWGSCMLWNTLGWLAYTLLQLMAYILGLAGWFLNFVIKHTIVNFSLYVIGDGTQAHPGMTGINIAWKMARDLMNIAFIFVLVYYAIKMILGLGNKSKVYSFISGVVLASLLINFSLFFTKVIIDTSNIATIGFYNSIMGNQPTESNAGLSDAYSKALALSNYFSGESLDEFSESAGTGSSLLLVGLFGSVLFLIVIFVFFAISIMLIVRFITLIILMMLSPLGFMGMALPGLGKYQTQWWDTLIGQCLFAPAFMLMTWVILTLMYSPGFTTFGGGAGNTAIWADLITYKNAGNLAETSAIGLLLNYTIIIGLTVASLTLAKSMANKGSNMVGKFTGQATAFAGGALLGGAAATMRRTVGGYYAGKANDEGLKERARAGDRSAQRQLARAQKLSSASFDFRESLIGKQTTKSLGLNLGKGTIFNEKAGQKGFQGILEDKKKKEAAFAKTLRPSDEYVADQKSQGEAAKKVLESDEFKQKENERKEKYLQSDEGKKINAALKPEDDYNKSKKEVDRLEAEKKKIQEAKTVNLADKVKKEEAIKKIDEQIKKAKEQSEALRTIMLKPQKELSDLQEKKKLLIESLKTADATQRNGIEENIKITQQKIDDAQKLTTYLDNIRKTRNEWKSSEMKNLEETAKKIDKFSKGADEDFKEGVNRYAARFENETAGDKAIRYTANLFKLPFVPFGANIVTAGDKKSIARSIKGAVGKPKGKNKENLEKIKDESTTDEERKKILQEMIEEEEKAETK